jgi:hypothetical protein
MSDIQSETVSSKSSSTPVFNESEQDLKPEDIEQNFFYI